MQYDISNFQEKYADLKWAAGKRKKMVESASWPPGDTPETKSFMVSIQLLLLLLAFDAVGGDAVNYYCISSFLWTAIFVFKITCVSVSV